MFTTRVCETEKEKWIKHIDSKNNPHKEQEHY